MTTKELVAESNRIEGIIREPLQKEIDEFEKFMQLDEVVVGDLERFVSIYQPGAKLRDKPGMDVYVGNHHPPKGGRKIRHMLDHEVLGEFFHGNIDAYTAHIWYKTLHPFMDGNGRSGRMLWYWMMREQPIARELGFLHTFYYQTLEASHG